MTDTPWPQTRRRVPGWLVDVVQTLAITILLFLGIQTFIAQPFQVEMESMQQTLQSGQYVLVDKLTPRFGPYHRGDIVVFRPPATVGRDAPFIKRVIGVPGDTVTMDEAGRVSVNGVALDEPYVFIDQGATVPVPDEHSWTVGDDQLFVLGDHRNRSDDSRVFGVIPVDRVVGRAFISYWPPPDIGILQTPIYPSLGG